ncbi:MAG: octaprenyl diphosphate synthase [Bdellovibrio sp. CG10_big_fil_rev_8_21_14_0_10_47_8]|nr:MAG: octaprenyl diphosphate synthase [Bdellovibrio sp. CG10_big_fil_rev_8_21_14_0_10_47_8]
MDIKIYDPKDFPAYLPKLNLLYDDLFSGGKGFRSKLIQLFAHHLSMPEKAENLLSQTIEFIHNASLLHDDLVDRSHLRRGKTSAWLRFTPEYAVLAGDYLLARVMVNLSGFGNIRLVHYTAEIISDLLEGEWLQDSLVGDFNVELSQLDRVHNLKTASLFKWCLRSPFIAIDRYETELHTTLEEMGTLLGQLFQRSDDLLDYNIRNFEGKAVLGDLKSGYLNSFAAFASRGFSSEQKINLRQVQTLPDFYSVLGSEKRFHEVVQEFDERNVFLIQLYQHHLKTFSQSLTESEQGLIPKLESLTDLLYWRKKSG